MTQNTHKKRDGFSHLELKVHGMDCAEEVATLKREILPTLGANGNLSFDLLNCKVTITSEEFIRSESILAAIKKTGMKAEIWQKGQTLPQNESWWQKHSRTASTATSAVFLLAGFLFHAFAVKNFWMAFGGEGTGQAHEVPFAARGFYLVAIVSGGWFILPKAFYSLKKIRPDMNLLMTIAVCGAILIGEWFEAATVAFLFSISLLLESWSVGRARKAIQSLMSLTPSRVRLKDSSGKLKEVEPAEVPVGSITLVRPGEKFALDGKVVSGSSYVNQAAITGESIPVFKEQNDEVFAATINGDGALEVETTKLASDTMLSRIIGMVSDAQSKKGPSEQWVDKFAVIYTPIVLLLACGVLFIPPLFFQGNWTDWVYRSLVLLVIACPCALVISTPVSIVSALAAAAKNGILIKGGTYIEAPAHLKAIAFDKTGTLTQGKPRVSEITPLVNHTESELLALAAGMESHSDHPLAKAILEHAEQRGIKPSAATDFQNIQGKGATALIKGKAYWLGSHRFLEEKGQETPEVHKAIEEKSFSGKSVVVLGNETHVCGFIALNDSLRTGAKKAIEDLRQKGVERLVMLTGDNRTTAKNIGGEAGVDEVLSELLPLDKVKSIQSLNNRYGTTAMVGDGINDAPALAAASIGIAMGAAGSDIALETADIALMSDDLSKLPWLIDHSRKTLRIIRQNITASLLVKAVFVLLTFLGYSSLWSAIAADMGVSLAVVFNGLRLLNDNS